MKRPFHPAVCRSVRLPEDRRVLAVSDIHGNLEYLQGVLAEAAFTPDDVLVVVGDLMSKGLRSLDTLRYVMELSRTHTVYTVAGNCDDVLLRDFTSEMIFHACTQWGEHMPLGQMQRELGFPLSGPEDVPALLRAVEEHFAPELAFVDQMATILESEHYLFVHGGVPRPADFQGLDAWSCMKNDDFLSQGVSFPKWCVVGHWPTTLYWEGLLCHEPYFVPERKIASIDGACVLKVEGQLNALALPPGGEGPFRWYRYDALPKARALDGQRASRVYRSFKWTDRWVEPIREEGGCVLCRHRSDGELYWIPSVRLWREGADVCAMDSTDYRLEVAPGDVLSLVAVTGRGAFAKKDGVVGWYAGGLEPLADEICAPPGRKG